MLLDQEAIFSKKSIDFLLKPKNPTHREYCRFLMDFQD